MYFTSNQFFSEVSVLKDKAFTFEKLTRNFIIMLVDVFKTDDLTNLTDVNYKDDSMFALHFTLLLSRK